MNLGQFLANHWADLVGVAGLALTIWAEFKAKTAAEQAREASRQTTERLATLDTLADLSAAIATMEEIKRLHRTGAWDIVLDRHSAVVRHLGRARATSPNLNNSQRADLDRSIAQFRMMEGTIESTVEVGGEIEIARLNSVVSKEIDATERILSAIRRAGA